MNKIKILIFSGPSGSGKSTIIKNLLSKYSNLHYVKSYTTRAIRKNESNEDYYFIPEEAFKRKIKENQLLEYNIYSNNYYGTDKNSIMSNKINILDIDVNGFKKIKSYDKFDIYSIFIDTHLQKDRLLNRNTISQEELNFRLEVSEEERKNKDLYNYQIMNDDLDETNNKIYNTLCDWKIL